MPLSDISLNLLSSFQGLQETLSVVSSYESTFLSNVAKSLFALLDEVANNIGNLSEELSSLNDAIPTTFSAITEAISSLKIGTGISDAVVDIENNFLKVIQVLDDVQNSESNVTTKFNDAVLQLATSVQVVIVSIALIAEKAALNIGSVSTEAKEVIVSLTLILNTTVFIVRSISSLIASKVSPDAVTPTSSALNSFLVIIERIQPSITTITTLISSSVKSSLSLVISTIGVTLTPLTHQLKESMDKLQTSVVLEISNQLESILFKVIGSHDGFTKSVSPSTATITACISIISSSDLGIQSKVSRQLYPVFRALLQLTASDDEIITEFISSLSIILDILKSTTNNLTLGIGVEVTGALIKSIENIFDFLKEMLFLVNHKTINLMNMDRITKECAKAVQVFDSIVVATLNTISESISSANSLAFEAVIASQFLHSTVLYVVEWITSVSASVYVTKAGKTHELLSSLAVIVVVMLQQDSKTIEMIAGSVSHSISDVVLSITSSASLRSSTANAAISNISGVNTNTTVKFDQISSGGGSAVPIEGIVNTTEGNLSRILNGLTGSLSSISNTFTSSLNRLKSSLKQIVSSDSELLQTISGVLISVITKLSEISGSATQILSLTSNSLNLFFGQLLETSSRLSALGDVCVSFSSSIIETSTALHSLIYAINDYKGTVHLLFDSIKMVAKSVQVLISTFSAIIHAAVNANEAVLNSVSVTIVALPYLVSTIILVIQQVVGATLPTVSATVGSITTPHHDLTLSISDVLETLTSITADMTTLVVVGIFDKIPSNILLSVSNLNNSTSSSLSKISGIVANIKASLSLADQAS